MQDDLEPELDPFQAELENALLHSLEEVKPEKKNRALPEQLFIFPVTRRPFFPGMAAPLVVEPGPFYEVLKLVAKSAHKCLGVVMTKQEEIDIHKATFSDFHPVGVMARLLRIIPMEAGGAQVILSMEQRMEILSPLPHSKGLKAKVAYHQDPTVLTQELKAYAISIISTIRELLKLNPLFKEELQIFLSHSDFTEPGKLADFAVALTTASREELQDVLATYDLPSRIDKALLLLKKELDISILQNDINKKIEATINKGQREYFLKEQLKAIKKELGLEKEDKSLDREKFEGRLKERKVPPDAMKVIQEEMDKLAVVETQSPEYNLLRNYLDWLTILPWGIHSPEPTSLEAAETLLAHEHFGLQDIKDRVLELMSVGRLRGGMRGTILCLVGPPGVGKTSVGKSIAKALNRKFYRFSVGGMRDEAEIKGHRRTYVGAMPGKILQALKSCQTMNPVIMLDEVDKMGKSFHGDPASALLEVLDPEQNSDFLDHYLDVRCDLSDILFILTANVLDSIPDALKDRMEVLRLSGYVLEEKLEIANKFLIPKNRKQMGLKTSQIAFSQDALKALINGYAREAGVRSLENWIKKTLSKVAVRIVRGSPSTSSTRPKKTGTPPPKKYTITKENLQDFIGKPIFTSDRIYEKTPPGVCTGLAWTALGGATLYVESVQVAADKTGMMLTGQAGDVMKESAHIAWNYLHSAIEKYAPGRTFFKKSQVHIHIPEGATPKDGPSAGVTLVTSLLSLLLQERVSESLGMTGELTLTGLVLPVGGIKEKTVAAKRSGLKTLILPKENRKDWEELPDYVRKGLTVHFVEHYDEIFQIVFHSFSGS